MQETWEHLGDKRKPWNLEQLKAALSPRWQYSQLQLQQKRENGLRITSNTHKKRIPTTLENFIQTWNEGCKEQNDILHCLFFIKSIWWLSWYSNPMILHSQTLMKMYLYDESWKVSLNVTVNLCISHDCPILFIFRNSVML